MAVKRSTKTGRIMEPASGSRVTVRFGHRDTTGIVTGKTITGRYAVRLDLDGADEPVLTSYARDEIRVP